MNRPQPPALATWLMSALFVGHHVDALIGDLIEQHRRGRSSAWYWRQAVRAIVSAFAAELWEHKRVAVPVLALGWYLPQIYMAAVRPRWIAALEAYSLHLLTTRIVWCLLVAVVARVFVRVQPRRRGMIVTLFMATQVLPCLPYLRIAVTDWLYRPDAFWFYNALSYAFFALVAIPISVLVGGRRKNRLT